MYYDADDRLENPRLRPEIKKQWLKALRSGDYEQGKGALRTTDIMDGKRRYCCLGVLCDLAVREGILPEPRESLNGATDDVSEALYGADDDAGVLPTLVQEWAFEPMPENVRQPQDPVCDGKALSGWNDIDGADFQRIAELVETYL